ncbi:hypothetical protein D3C76_1114300 [compost metagenome]
MHQLQAFDPARNHAAHRQVDRAAALDGAVEHGAIGQLAFIVHGHDIGRLRLRAIGLLDDFVLQAGLGGNHALALAVVLEEFLAGFGGVFGLLGHTLFGALLQGGEGFGQLLICDFLLLLADGIFDTLGDGLGIQVIHAFLNQALAHVQADSVRGLLGRGLELNFSLRIATGQNKPDQCNGRSQPMLFHADFLVCPPCRHVR